MLKNTKASAAMSKEKLSTLAKTHTGKSSIISPHSSSHEKMNIKNPSEQMDIEPQESIKAHNTQTAL